MGTISTSRGHAKARKWLAIEVNLGLAPDTIDVYVRALEDYRGYWTRPSQSTCFQLVFENRSCSSISTGHAQCGQRVILVEGFFDCLNVHQAGLPCVVALMGCNLSRHQEQLLEKHFREVLVLMDGDKAGRTAGAVIAGRLVSRLSTRLVEIPTGTQPDQLGADQIRCLCIPGYF